MRSGSPRRRFELDQAAGIEQPGRRDLIERRKYLSALCIHPGGHKLARRRVSTRDLSKRLEGRDTDNRAPGDEGQPLDRGEANPQPGERPGTGSDGKQIDVRQGDAMRVEHGERFGRKTLRVRARRIAGPLLHNHVLVDERDASRARRSVQREHTHALD